MVLYVGFVISGDCFVLSECEVVVLCDVLLDVFVVEMEGVVIV